MKKEIYTCDGCGKVKGEANHWYCAVLSEGPSKYYEIKITSFSVGGQNWEHFCGEECLLKMVARNLPK